MAYLVKNLICVTDYQPQLSEKKNFEPRGESSIRHQFINVGIRVTRVVGDSGAVLTIETTRNSELIDTIFKKFALKMVELSCIKGLANNCQNKTSL